MAKRKSKTGVPEARKPEGERAAWLLEKMHEATFQYTGDLGRLEAALGFLVVGHYYGWKVLYIIHTKKTVRLYEELLGISVREDFDEVGPYAERSNGWQLIKDISNFWKVVSGEIKVDGDRKEAM